MTRINGDCRYSSYEKVQIVNINNGTRFETYVIKGKKGRHRCLNGAAAPCQPGDLIIIIAYALVDEKSWRALNRK